MLPLSRKRIFTQRALVLFLLILLVMEMGARNRQILSNVRWARPFSGLADRRGGTHMLIRPQDPGELAVASAGTMPESVHDVPDVNEVYAASDVASDWRGVVDFFMRDMPIDLFKADTIEHHFWENLNNAQKTCVLVRIRNGTATFIEKYKSMHTRAASVRYMLRKLAKRKAHILHNVTLLVMLSDGHRPKVPTFGSARHWTNWNLMIPAPLGNFRGHFQGWGNPLEGWDRYVREHIVATHSDYPWYTKISKAVFRGALSMQTYKLGSCNEVNGAECQRAKRWHEVNRGVLYVQSRRRRDLFDVGFSALKPKWNSDPDQFEGAPRKASPIDFRDFQKYKYVINCGSNQDWSERMRLLLYMNSAVVYHMAETQEFFTPLLKPWVHVIPTNLTMDDIVRNVEWAIRHDDVVRKIVQNQHWFAGRYVSEKGMETYWEIALEEFAARQGVDSSLVW